MEHNKQFVSADAAVINGELKGGKRNKARRVRGYMSKRCVDNSAKYILNMLSRNKKEPLLCAGRNLRICKDALPEFYKCKAFAVSRLFIPG